MPLAAPVMTATRPACMTGWMGADGSSGRKSVVGLFGEGLGRRLIVVYLIKKQVFVAGAEQGSGLQIFVVQ